MELNMSNNKINLSNPEKALWNNPIITKLDYVKELHKLAPFIIRHCKNRNLTCIRYPDGIEGKFFYQKNVPKHAPNWIKTDIYADTEYINLVDAQTLMWLGNLASIELHLSFHAINKPQNPVYIVLDLDPSEGVSFELVREGGLRIHEELEKLSIESIAKTSGATGIQILIPHGNKLNYNQAREFNGFLANYFVQKYPKIFTIERTVKNRGEKIYFDYLQMWTGKSIIAPYSPRAREGAPISMPLFWKELEEGIVTTDFNLLNIHEILISRGDILADYEQLNNDSVHSIVKEIRILQ